MMRTIRTKLCSVFLVLPFLIAPVHAQNYPVKPIRLIVPLAAGSTADILARVVGDKLSKNLGQQVLIDNRPGAGGNIGAELAAKASADGYTLVIATIATHGINPSLFRTLPFDPIKDFTPITLLVSAPNLLILHPSNPARNVKELIASVKAKPGQITFGSGGNGTSQHLSGELFNMMAGVKMVHVPYKGAAQAVTAVMSGEIDLMFPNIPVAQSLIQAGRLKGIAVTTPKRLSWLPEMPTVGETIEGFEVLPWFSIMGPANLPESLVQRLHTEFMKVMTAPDVRDNLIKQGFEIQTSSPQELGAFVKSEIAKWARVVEQSGARVD
jgi:tripartite-type tricarboxylate transporter receptor subunit TctC